MTGLHRTLTVSCRSGLGNRLRVLLSGTILARASQRDFQMIWPPSDACSATFDRLFDGDWHVVDSDPVGQRRLVEFRAVSTARVPDLLTSAERDLAMAHVGWFFEPSVYAHHARLMVETANLVGLLTPTRALRQRIDDFVASRFRPSMIGVHLRRGDYVRRHPDLVANTDLVMAAVDRLLADDTSAGILLCSDDGGVDQVTGRRSHEGVREQFATRYGSRVVWTEPRSLDRRDPAAVEDAVVDLWLLRRTQKFLGTTRSSFSELAVLGRPVTGTFYGAPTTRYVQLARLARLTGFEAALGALPLTRSRLGPNPSLASMWSFYASLPAAAGRRVRQWVTQGRR